MAIFSRIKERLGFGGNVDNYEDDFENEYVEIDPSKDRGPGSKIIVKSFTISNFNDIKDVLDVIREGYTIALVNIKPLRDRDVLELKRTVSKLKKTTDAVEGDIAGVSEDWIVVTPSFAHIHRDTKEESASL